MSGGQLLIRYVESNEERLNGGHFDVKRRHRRIQPRPNPHSHTAAMDMPYLL